MSAILLSRGNVINPEVLYLGNTVVLLNDNIMAFIFI